MVGKDAARGAGVRGAFEAGAGSREIGIARGRWTVPDGG